MRISLVKLICPQLAGTTAINLLADETKISKSRIKDALSKGAISLKRGQKKRLRRATEILRNGDVIELHYDDDILSRPLPENIRLIFECSTFSAWYKPAGMLAQGNQFGDHLALLRYAEKTLHKPVYLVHRLDRETAGIMLIAHNKKNAAHLSSQFANNQVKKVYHARSKGQALVSDYIDIPLDGKASSTSYKRICYDEARHVSQLEVHPHSGRTHQIRRHLAAKGLPILGDYRYGTPSNNNPELQLEAISLQFINPVNEKNICLSI